MKVTFSFKLLLILYLNTFRVVNSLPSIINIGGLFTDEEEEESLAFKIAIERVNSDLMLILPTKLIGMNDFIEPFDSMDAGMKTCSLIRSGIAALFGPLNEISAMHVRCICDTLEIPHIDVTWNVDEQNQPHSLNFYPHPKTMAKAFIDLIIKMDWNSFALMYEDNVEILFVNEFFKEIAGEQSSHDPKWTIHLYKFEDEMNYRQEFRDVLQRGEKNIVLHVKTVNLYRAMKQAQQVGLLTQEHSFIITSLDFHTIEYEDFMYSNATIVCYTMIHRSSPELITLLHSWNFYADELEIDIKTPINIKTSTALIYDSVKHFAKAIKEADISTPINRVPSNGAKLCDAIETWKQGTTVINQIKSTDSSGITGLINFNLNGHRSQLSLHLEKLDERGLVDVGRWTDHADPKKDRLVAKGLSRNLDEIKTSRTKLKGRHFIVSTFLNDPYTMLVETKVPLSGNDQYEGYCVDVINELSKFLGFTYEFKMSEFKKSGNWNKTLNKWVGVVSDVIYSNETEDVIGIVDLTITEDRGAVVDFSHPFMNTGIGILFKKPRKSESSTFAFLDPFSTPVWLCTVVTAIIFSFFNHFVGRVSPYEWTNPHPCRQDEDIYENPYNIRNSVWFVCGNLMQQGSDIAPRALSTRFITGFWYFFTLILISSYTANLAAFLTIEKPVFPFYNAKELLEQNKIKYGCLKDGATCNFFKHSTHEVYKKMYKYMKQNPDVYVSSNREGEEKVKKGDYAFFMEGTSIAYKSERDCDLTQVGKNLDSKGYGIAIKKNAEYLREISQGVLYLQESGTLATLYNKWWKEKRGGGACLTAPPPNLELGVANVAGVFIVLVVGLFTTIAVAFFELFYTCAKKQCHKRELPYWDRVKEELRFAFDFKVKVKEVSKKNSRVDSMEKVSLSTK